MKMVYRSSVVLRSTRADSVDIGAGKIVFWEMNDKDPLWLNVWVEMSMDNTPDQESSQHMIAIPSNCPVPDEFTYVGTQTGEGRMAWHIYVGPGPYSYVKPRG